MATDRAAGAGPRQTVQPTIGFGPRGGPGAGFRLHERPKDASQTFLHLWQYLQRQRLGLIVVAVVVLATTALSLLGPYLLGKAIDHLLLPEDRPGLLRLVLLLLGSYAALTAAAWVQQVLMIRIAQHTVRDLRRDLFGRLQTLPLRFFDENLHGELMSRLTNDVEQVNTVLSSSVASFFQAVFMLVGVVAVMLATNVPLALVSLAVVPLMVVTTRFIATNSRQGFRDQQQSLGVLNGIIEETITGARVIHAYGREQAVIDEFDDANGLLRAASIRAQTYSGLLGPLGSVVNKMGFAVVAVAGAWMVVASIATVGTVVAFLTYSQQLRRPINELASLFNTIQAALAGAERVFAILEEKSEFADDMAQPLSTIKGKVAFDDVTFSYKQGVPVLKHVSLTAEPGQTVALVGPTGAGKTTIINLLSRFYDVDSGCISVDDLDIRTVRKADLRRQLGVVLQDTYMFAESVMDNIRYGRLDATEDEVIAAARLANADHFIRRLPQGYATMLSERASNLSQGQRQLLAIARAILADPRILVLDEATSSVDTRTEVQIQEALLRLMRGRTSFVIAHRLSTIRNADKILVIRDGEIVEQGTHSELLAKKGFYERLYMSQFKGMAMPAPGTPAG